MSKTGPFVILEDDHDDQELLRDALKELGVLNSLHFFNNGVTALEYLKSTEDQPFIIFCDINLPLMNGLQFRQHIEDDERLRMKSIPFVFFTTSGDSNGINRAYKLTVQGYFTKENTFPAIKETLKLIIDYWAKCRHPDSA